MLSCFILRVVTAIKTTSIFKLFVLVGK